jgi:hypothetical protein
MKVVTKQDSVEQLKANFSKSSAVVFADYKGVTSEEMNSLLMYLATSYQEMDDDDDEGDTSDPDFWLNLN